MDYSYLSMILANNLELKFRLFDTPVTKQWIECFIASSRWPMDHANRFYGFDSVIQEQQRALEKIQNCVETINSYQPIIERNITNISDQDTLNYLHNIFEKYHGLLDQQGHEFWLQAPDYVRKSLAELNVAVHRCEFSYRTNKPMITCTWYGMPKIKKIPKEYFYRYGTLSPPFGTLYLEYVEIGKTLEDLTQDNDKYIADNAFKPFNYYSADFSVRLFEDDYDETVKKLSNMNQYFLLHKDFFLSHGISEFTDVRLLPFYFPLAKLVENMPRQELLQQIQSQQYITQVTLQ